MRYESQIAELKSRLDQASSVLFMLPAKTNTDCLASALAFYLSLKQLAKKVSIVSEVELRVTNSHLFGIGEIKKELPESSGGNLTLVMEGVVENGKVPSLEKLDWSPDGNNLNLIFHVLPGKKFEPIKITPKFDKATFDVIIFIGGSNLVEFGSLYTKNIDKLGEAVRINIDNSQNNNLFGTVNIVDPPVSLTEIVAQILEGLGLSQNEDIATNLIYGIYDATNNLNQNVSAETFFSLGQALKKGGKLPRDKAYQTGGFDLSRLNRPESDVINQIKTSDSLVSDEAIQKAVSANEKNDQTSASQLETPMGEFATSSSVENPAPDWLTPKIFKGGLG